MVFSRKIENLEAAVKNNQRIPSRDEMFKTGCLIFGTVVLVAIYWIFATILG